MRGLTEVSSDDETETPYERGADITRMPIPEPEPEPEAAAPQPAGARTEMGDQ